VVERSGAVVASGTVDANTTADLAFQVGGRVGRVLVEEGQSVRAGQLLAAIDPVDYELEARRAAATATQAADEYQRMKQVHARGSLAPNDFAKFEAAAEAAAAPYLENNGVSRWDLQLVDPVPGAPGQFYGARVSVTIEFRTTLLGIVPAYETMTITQAAEAVAVTGM